MKRAFLFIIGTSLLSAMLTLPVGQANAQIITFDFNNTVDNMTGFDNAGLGATMTATDDFDTVTITTVDIIALEFDATFTLTGNTLSALNGDGVETSISGSNAVGVNNPTISNSNYATIGSGGGENGDFNPGESWVIEFDKDVVLKEFNFSSIGAAGGESFDVTIEGGATMNFADGSAGDDFADPFGTTIITAGTNLTFTCAGTIADTNVRISEVTVELVGGSEVLLGDVDLSGTVDFLDITPFIGVLSGGTFQAEADCDESGDVTFLDITPFINILSGSGS